jgi:nitroreductase
MDWVRWDALAELARWAPTPHNTQPFRIVPKSAERAELVLLTERLLPREDHGNLYVTSAFGTFARALELAARHHGVELAVEPVPELDTETLEKQGPRVVLGSAVQRRRTEPVAADLVLARRTSRLPYHDRAIDPVELEREEIRGWYRFGETAEHGDGLWQLPLNQPAWEIRAAFGTPWLYQWPGFRGFAIRRYLRTQRGTRHTALLCGPFSRWPELYRAGRLLLDFWLAMARFGIYMQPMGSMLTNARYVKEITRRFDVNDCWLVLRLGYSDEPPRAPRLKDIVIHE